MSDDRLLAAQDVVGGLWHGAFVDVGARPVHPVRGVWQPPGVEDQPRGWVMFAQGLTSAHTYPVRERDCSLVLPGPLGLGLLGLRQRTIERASGQDEVLPDWLVRSIAELTLSDPEQAEIGAPMLLSTYLARTDRLAASYGWPTGPGAPVYRWRRTARNDRRPEDESWELVGWELRGPVYTTDPRFDGDRFEYTPALVGVRDLLDALLAVIPQVP